MASHKRKRDKSMSETEVQVYIQRKKSLQSARIIPSAISRHNQLHSPLLRLPGEIRNKIYGYVLGGKEYYYVQDVAAYRTGPQRKTRIDLALMRVCRQAYTETSLLPFQLNSFEGLYYDSLPVFGKMKGSGTILRTRQLGAITTVTMDCGFLIDRCVRPWWMVSLDTSRLSALKRILIRDSGETIDLDLDDISQIMVGVEKWAGRSDLEIIYRLFSHKAYHFAPLVVSLQHGKINLIEVRDITGKPETYRAGEKATWPKELGGESSSFPLPILGKGVMSG